MTRGIPGQFRPLHRDSRAVSTALGYVLGLTISALLISVMLYGVGGFVEDQREQVVREELTVVGQQLASDLTATDRLARGSPDDTTAIRIESRLPAQIANTGYSIAIEDDPGSAYRLVLRTENPDVVVTVGFTAETVVDERTVSGGGLVIEYGTGATPTDLEVSNA